VGAYEGLLTALNSGRFEDFERIPLGGILRLGNPMGSAAFDLVGPDSHDISLVPPPRLASSRLSAEMAELYWMALVRDVPFSEYGANPLVAQAATDLARMFARAEGTPYDRSPSPLTLFSPNYGGISDGPCVSQFLLQDYFFDGVVVSQR